MKKFLILGLCALLLLSGCSKAKIKDEQQKIYNGFRDSLMDNGELFSSNIPFDGRCKETFKIVEEEFKNNFTKGWESEGASIAVFYKGECVVDIYGGYADKSCNRKWTSDTLSVMFSRFLA